MKNYCLNGVIDELAVFKLPILLKRNRFTKEMDEAYIMTKKVAIVTGATRLQGIGAAVCEELARRGVHIFFTYWSAYDVKMPWGTTENEQQILQNKIREYGVECGYMELDLSSPSAAALLLDAVAKEVGEPSILINNAAHSTHTPYETLTAEQLDAHYAVNFRATALLSAEFIRRFSFQRGGRIINLTSGQSLGPMPNELAYIAAKGAVEAFTTSLAPEVAKRGVTVNAVNPGPTNTGWMTEDIQNQLLPRFPLGRIGEPQDAARLIAFLAGEEAEWVTGQVIHSTGGFW